MASAPSFAQHYIECENCEENPAQFLCKTCPGHLCGACKAEHESRKIFQNHDIIHLTSEMGDMLELLYCSEHKNEKLKCYCSQCQIPVCTQCMIESHNGHKIENLAPVYYRIKDQFLKEKEEIEDTLLPKYEELLAKERKKKVDISKKTDEVQKQIEDHIERVIQRFTAIKQEKIRGLRQEETKALTSVSYSETEIQSRIDSLKAIKAQLSDNLGAKPGIIFFKATNADCLNKMRHYPNSSEYTLEDFSPGDINKITQDANFGNVPTFTKEEEKGDISPNSRVQPLEFGVPDVLFGADWSSSEDLRVPETHWSSGHPRSDTNEYTFGDFSPGDVQRITQGANFGNVLAFTKNKRKVKKTTTA